ncbi:uncharacterized CRM domain-containing protein At3g25440, chloroplastic isoform X1 [Telopea speciosissima]|uniref:uncharacterized CRM domain-containing protein At3g25440, chloroplastic isoform X1 n=2 Tax=Telopea speciosissima TaxID=54955 RepID=UPI001CC6EF91|nr:uncharacterized CRM domain-containing protein At3g25440, chloroplastic isoform X1 [Telopea speciosissima]
MLGVFTSAAVCKSRQIKTFMNNSLFSILFLHRPVRWKASSYGILCKVFNRSPSLVSPFGIRSCHFMRCFWSLSIQHRNMVTDVASSIKHSENGTGINGNTTPKVKRKKLKGKRAVVRWLKFFRWKKMKEYERMTAEEKLLYKLRKAEKKESRIVEALKKIEPAESLEATHDPEILTPEEHFFFLKMGLKNKNYVPVGRRGIFQGVILNMHLHWKKHQTVKVVVKNFSSEEVKEIAAELARLSGGIVLDIHEENTIIMYRGKNYSQPPTEIMSPKITLSRKKALDKSKNRDALRAVRKYIPRLEQELELLQAKAKMEHENKTEPGKEGEETQVGSNNNGGLYDQRLGHSAKLEEILSENNESPEDDSMSESGIGSESEALSDIFETDSDGDVEQKAERSLYLDEFEKFPAKNSGEPEDFEDHLRQISADSRRKDMELPDLDEVDRMFLRAGSLLKKKWR